MLILRRNRKRTCTILVWFGMNAVLAHFRGLFRLQISFLDILASEYKSVIFNTDSYSEHARAIKFARRKVGGNERRSPRRRKSGISDKVAILARSAIALQSWNDPEYPVASGCDSRPWNVYETIFQASLFLVVRAYPALYFSFGHPLSPFLPCPRCSWARAFFNLIGKPTSVRRPAKQLYTWGSQTGSIHRVKMFYY